MAVTTQSRFRSAVVAIAPAVLCAGFVYHPYVSKATDAEAIAEAVLADTTRWGLAHAAIGIGYALTVLAFLAIRNYLREVGEERWSSLALPLIAVGSALFAILPGMEFAPLAAAETGGDAEAAQEELAPWFNPHLRDSRTHLHARCSRFRARDRAQRSAEQEPDPARRRSARRDDRRALRPPGRCADSDRDCGHRRSLAGGIRNVEASDGQPAVVMSVRRLRLVITILAEPGKAGNTEDGGPASWSWE